jgi:transcription elongation factor GreA
MTSLALEARSNSSRWPMTEEAWHALAAELANLRGHIAAIASENAEADHVIKFRLVQAARRLEVLTSVFHAAERVDEPARVVIGRRTTLLDEGDQPVTYDLVYPGDGDPLRGSISADSPIGSAILGGAVGDRVAFVAPAGPRVVTIAAVE